MTADVKTRQRRTLLEAELQRYVKQLREEYDSERILWSVRWPQAVWKSDPILIWSSLKKPRADFWSVFAK